MQGVGVGVGGSLAAFHRQRTPITHSAAGEMRPWRATLHASIISKRSRSIAQALTRVCAAILEYGSLPGILLSKGYSIPGQPFNRFGRYRLSAARGDIDIIRVLRT
jgi:hypothetical protein